MPNLRAPTCSVGRRRSVADPAAPASAAPSLRHGARGRRGDRCRDGVDVLLEGAHAGAVRVGFVREVDHVVQEIPPRVDEIELALQLRDSSLAARRARPFPLRRAAVAWLRSRPESRSRRASRSRWSRCSACGEFARLGRLGLLHLRLAAQELGVRARKLERERDDAVRRLPVGIEDQQVARLRGGLLLNAEHAVPVHRLVENLDDLVARHDGARGERRRGLRGVRVLRVDPRREGQGKTDRCDSLQHDDGGLWSNVNGTR